MAYRQGNSMGEPSLFNEGDDRQRFHPKLVIKPVDPLYPPRHIIFPWWGEVDGEHKALNQVPWSMYLAIKILPVYKEPIKLSSLGGGGYGCKQKVY